MVLTEGRPTIALETYVRLMVLKQRYRWGYRTLVAEVSDSIHLRRFCRISLGERVPDESTVRKLTRRIGAETVSEMTRALIVKATREKRFRPRAVRIDSTVIEADVKYPTDAGLASSGVQVLAQGGAQARQADRGEEGAGAGSLAGDGSQARSDHPHDPAALGRGQAGSAEADRRDRASLLERSIKEARRLAAIARRKARGRGAKAKLKAAAELGADGGSLREGRQADPPARRGRADQGPDRVAVRSGRPADPQGQAWEAERIWVRLRSWRR